MSGTERILGVLFCVFCILRIINRELITFIPFYVVPLLIFSVLSAFLYAIHTDNEASIDYKDAAVRLFVAGAVAVLALNIFGERSYDKKGNVIRSQPSQELHYTYNSWTRSLVMGLDVFRPNVYEDSPYDGTTLLKIIALALVVGGPLMALALQGWYLPQQKEKEKKQKEEEAEGKKEDLRGDIRRLKNIREDLENEISKKDIEIQALRAENRGLKKKLGDS